MNERERAEEHLRVIRTLMERATIYRAISAPTALVGGLLSSAVSAVSIVWLHKHARPDLPHFGAIWGAVLVITLIANTYFVWRAASKRGEPVISPSMKVALHSLFPPVLVAAVITVPVCVKQMDYSDNHLATAIWTLCYGLALLATGHFAPKSLVLLGWAFVLMTLVTSLLWPLITPKPPFDADWPNDFHASLWMGVTFGLFHLVYATCTWPRKAQQTESQLADARL